MHSHYFTRPCWLKQASITRRVSVVKERESAMIRRTCEADTMSQRARLRPKDCGVEEAKQISCGNMRVLPSKPQPGGDREKVLRHLRREYEDMSQTKTRAQMLHMDRKPCSTCMCVPDFGIRNLRVLEGMNMRRRETTTTPVMYLPPLREQHAMPGSRTKPETHHA